ncbi:tRNA pseudouridine(55) synthase TruB [bacterium]|nr:tRNA pseudouridine(55) synthase TruB [bacterium]
MIDGIILIDKEKGITSYDVIRKLKRDFEKGTKVGHAGTLDPFATGLLIVMVGRQATKLMERFHTLKKRYVVEAELGFKTDTQDITGEVVKESVVKDTPTKEVIEELIAKEFVGKISQTPPHYSAKKIKGRKSYELAREGKEFKLLPKEIEIFECKILEYEYPKLELEVLCSTGTYIRTLVNDIGERLGTYATAVELRRLNIGKFSVEDVGSSIMGVDKVIEMINNG